jgi:hypothetical protein
MNEVEDCRIDDFSPDCGNCVNTNGSLSGTSA